MGYDVPARPGCFINKLKHYDMRNFFKRMYDKLLRKRSHRAIWGQEYSHLGSTIRITPDGLVHINGTIIVHGDVICGKSVDDSSLPQSTEKRLQLIAKLS